MKLVNIIVSELTEIIDGKELYHEGQNLYSSLDSFARLAQLQLHPSTATHPMWCYTVALLTSKYTQYYIVIYCIRLQYNPKTF